VLVDRTALAHAAFVATAAHGGLPCDEQDYRRLNKALSLLEAYGILDPGGEPSARRRFHLRYVRGRISEIRAFVAHHSKPQSQRVSVIGCDREGEALTIGAAPLT
jgi:hypothetical protein